MVAVLLSNVAIDVEQFAIIGTYPPNKPGATWVQHAALLRVGCKLKRGDSAHLCHMNPPLELGPRFPHHYPAYDNPSEIHIVASISLTKDEIDAIDTRMAHLSTRTPTLFAGIKPLDQYVMCPPMRQTARDTNTGNRKFTQYSCVGFVLECYLGAKIDLLDWQSPDYPVTRLPELKDIYDFIVANDQVRQKIGLNGNGPWRVPLPGHLLHGLTRSSDEVRQKPYLPRATEESYFPARPTDPLTAAEHAESQRRAYLRALGRGPGNGILPPYNQAAAVQDFCEAAGEVTAERTNP